MSFVVLVVLRQQQRPERSASLAHSDVLRSDPGLMKLLGCADATDRFRDAIQEANETSDRNDGIHSVYPGFAAQLDQLWKRC